MTSNTSLYRHAIVLGLLTCVGPMAIDMYLPALPGLGASLGTDARAVQASLTAFYVALGAGQLVAGPLSDMYGRTRPMYLGLALFVLASIACALASTVDALVAFRFVQGLGACACMVTPRAVVRDLYTGPQAARLMSLLMVVYSVSPIVAPLAGSFIADAGGWRAVFWVLGALAALGLVLVTALLPESRPAEARLRSSFRGAMAGYGVLLRDRRFVSTALIASLTLACFFIYVANSPFVMRSHFGVGSRMYAVLFSSNAVLFIVFSQCNGWLAARFGVRRVLRVAVMAFAATMVTLLLFTLAGVDRLDLMVGLLMLGFGLNGLIVPSAFVLAMEGHPSLAGTASALIGTLNFAGGAVVVALVSPFADGTPLPMLAGIAACAVAVLWLALRTLGAGAADAAVRPTPPARPANPARP